MISHAAYVVHHGSAIVQGNEMVAGAVMPRLVMLVYVVFLTLGILEEDPMPYLVPKPHQKLLNSYPFLTGSLVIQVGLRGDECRIMLGKKVLVAHAYSYFYNHDYF